MGSGGTDLRASERISVTRDHGPCPRSGQMLGEFHRAEGGVQLRWRRVVYDWGSLQM